MWQLVTALSERSEAIIKEEGEIWQLKGHVAGYKKRWMCLQAVAVCSEAGKVCQAEGPVQEKKGEKGIWEQVRGAWEAAPAEDWDPET